MRYNDASSFYKKLFNEKVYKISLDGGMSCPNRDKNKNGGCIFCSSGGSGDFAVKYSGDIRNQINSAIKLVENKGAKKYIAYFQSYTNTFAPIDYLRKLFFSAIEDDRIIALSIATRPDSISDDCLKLLAELNKKKKVFVELGLQTSSNKTAIYINRGYDSSVYINTCKRLKEIGINIITHLIIGLPGEGDIDLLNSINFINEYTDGVKLQLLHILKNTKLEEIYNSGLYEPLELNEYKRLLALAINHLNPNIVVHRITGDGPKDLLVSPLYSLDKKRVLSNINTYFKNNDVRQGKYYKKIVHRMNLDNKPYISIKNKEKTIEMRLNDEKRSLINIGDYIEFKNNDTYELLLVKVINIYKYKDFNELYLNHNKISIGYKDSEDADPKDMNKYYSIEKISKYGVIGIEVEVI